MEREGDLSLCQDSSNFSCIIDATFFAKVNARPTRRPRPRPSGSTPICREIRSSNEGRKAAAAVYGKAEGCHGLGDGTGFPQLDLIKRDKIQFMALGKVSGCKIWHNGCNGCKWMQRSLVAEKSRNTMFYCIATFFLQLDSRGLIMGKGNSPNS